MEKALGIDIPHDVVDAVLPKDVYKRQVLIIVVMLLLSAFFSGMEIAFTSKNRLKLEIDRKQSRVIHMNHKICHYLIKYLF